jgi:hypothetical protein
MTLRTWFHLVGYPLTPWILYTIAFIFGLLTRKPEGRKERTAVSIFSLLFGTVVLLVEVL